MEEGEDDQGSIEADEPGLYLEHQEITREIIGAAYEVYKILGFGFLEKVYRKAMQVELIRRSLDTELEAKIKVQL